MINSTLGSGSAGTAFGQITNKNYIDYRTIDPNAQQTGQPWFRISDVSACDVSQNNPSGRGYTLCPFGVQFQKPVDKNSPLMSIVSADDGFTYQNVPVKAVDKSPLFGANFPVNSFNPPQLMPRANIRIGGTWRS